MFTQKNISKKAKMSFVALASLGIVALSPVGGVVGNVFNEPVIALAANDDTAQGVNEASRKELNNRINEYCAKNKYPVDGGGTLSGSQLVSNGDIIESNYNRLTKKGKQQLVTDMTQAVTNAVDQTQKQQEEGKNLPSDAITEQTKQNWIQQLQSNPGVGSRMLTDILQQVKPDYAGARYIFEPFAGPINIAIAFVVIIVMSLLALTFAIDLAFMYIPFFQAVAGDGNGGGDGKFKVGNLVSNEAKHAVQSSNNGEKNPATVYFKSRLFGVILLGLCILFFAQGQVYTLVSWVLDLVSGFLNLG